LGNYISQTNDKYLKIIARDVFPSDDPKVYNKKNEREKVERFESKQLYSLYAKDTQDVADKRSWQWVCSGNIKKSMEGYLFAAQEQALSTNWRKTTIEKRQNNPTCRLCKQHLETVRHIVSGCSELAQSHYKRRHDKMGLRIYWELCKRHGMNESETWYEEPTEDVRVSKDGRFEIWWDKSIHTTRTLDANRPDMVYIDKQTKKWLIIDFSVPWDGNIVFKEDNKIQRYYPLVCEMRRMYDADCIVVPLVVGALGALPKRLSKYLKQLDLEHTMFGLQHSALIGTHNILKKVLRSGTKIIKLRSDSNQHH
jgi:hypothetical protein